MRTMSQRMSNVPDVVEPQTTNAIAIILTTLSPEGLDQFLMMLSPAEVAEFALRASAIAKVASKAKALAHARLVELGQTGQVFTDPADGTPYQLTGGRHRKIKNIGGFLAQLMSDGVSIRLLSPFLASDAIKVGEAIEGDERIKEAVKQWALWQDDPLTLVELDPKNMKPVRR